MRLICTWYFLKLTRLALQSRDSEPLPLRRDVSGTTQSRSSYAQDWRDGNINLLFLLLLCGTIIDVCFHLSQEVQGSRSLWCAR